MIREQQILNPRKLRAARLVSRLNGSFYPNKHANAPLDKNTIKRILIQEHQCIGDVIMLEPALRALREGFPQAVIDLLCVPSVKSLAQKASLADHVLDYPNEKPLDETYDLAIDFHGDVRRLTSLRQYKSLYTAGFMFSGGAKYLTHVADYPYMLHQVERPFELLKTLGVQAVTMVPQLKGFENKLKNDVQILLHPGANHEGRQWPREHWIDLYRILSEGGYKVIYIVPPGESAPEGMDHRSGDLIALAELTASSAMLIGCDSMAVHLSAALGTPALAIFGSQDPELTKPYGPNGHFIMPEKECTHRRKDWRLCKECMKSVHPEEVASQVTSILSK